MVVILLILSLFGLVLPIVAGIGLIVESRKVFFKVIGGILLAQVCLTVFSFAAAWYVGKGIGDWANTRMPAEETFNIGQ